MQTFIYPTLILGGLGLTFGLMLAFASKVFHVDRDPIIDEIQNALPGVNCGGCGYAGCSALAEAVARGEAGPGACPVGGEKTLKALSEILGVSAGEYQKQAAHVACRGGVNAKRKYNYDGIEDCLAASLVAGGPLECSRGCLGLGSCVRVCPEDAITIVDGAALVDIDRCTACGLCVPSCPKNLISIVSAPERVFISCSSHLKGAEVRKQCSAGCIACGLCKKVCPVGAIEMEDNLAVIDYAKCIGCGKCVEVCPVKLIVKSGDTVIMQAQA